MTRTTLQNTTDSAIVLNESQAGILRRLSEVQSKGSYVVRSQLNQTYKEYLCVSKNSNQFTLSSDDLCEWKEILITNDTSGKLFWKGKLMRQKNTNGKNSSQTDHASGTSPPPSSLPKLWSKVVGWIHKPKQPDTIGTDASTTLPIATPGIDASTAPPAATITVTPGGAKSVGVGEGLE